jgi:hypothetical protein
MLNFDLIIEFRDLLKTMPTYQYYEFWYEKNKETINKINEVTEEEWHRMAEILR